MNSHINTIAQYKKNNFFKIMMITVCSVLCVAIIIFATFLNRYIRTYTERSIVYTDTSNR